MTKKTIKLWFDGVPLLGISALATEIMSRGWEFEQSQPGEWWAQFSREVAIDDFDWDDETDALKQLFGERWTRCELT